MGTSGKISLLIATRNAHKVAEIRAILGKEFDYLNLNDFPGAPTVVEDADSFTGNATKKAVELAKWLSLSPHSPLDLPRRSAAEAGLRPFFILADDSGLEVQALNGAPGVRSARFAAVDSSAPGNSPDSENNAKLLRLLRVFPAGKRSARFNCVLALTPVKSEAQDPKSESSASPVCYADEFELQTEIFEGACEGRIDFGPHGLGGFGYDPLFIPDGFDQSFAQLGEDIKNQISHRSKALAKLKARLTT